MAPERAGTSSNGNGRTLHNFSLPPRLSWGTQKLLRCSTSASSLTDTVSRSRSPPPPPKRHRHVDDGGGDRIDVVREIMLDLRPAFIGNGSMPPQPPVAASAEVRTWNLRTRRAALSASPVRNEVAPAVPLREREESEVAVVRRVKFSVPLSRQEVEDDFVAMLGRRPPRKPKKRPRYIQKELETIFPGVWLSEITADMYKVNEEVPEPPK